MKILLDNCVDRKLAGLIADHDVSHVLSFGWDNLANGKLLDAAENRGFEVLLTVDRNMRFQQSFAKRKIGLFVIESRRIDLDSLKRFVPLIAKRLADGVSPGEVVVVSQSDLAE